MGRFSICAERSVVWVRARSSLHPIEAETRGLEGWLEVEVRDGGDLDLGVAPRGHLELPVARLSSKNALYDREMRRRIDARRHPSIVGDLSRMEQTGDHGRYRVEGDVTLKGMTRPVADEMAISLLDARTLCLEGSHTFDVTDFGISPPRIVMLQVHPDVQVHVRIVAEAVS
jgi:polyisoprenoid-binding protein YceI